MPLRAIVDGDDVLAPALSDAEWGLLKSDVRSGARAVVLPCCTTEGRLRVSKLGTKHFFHKAKTNCDWKPETYQHLKAKWEIVEGARKAGYEASTEVSGNDWRADVLATKGNVRLAIEVQWSRQTMEETETRQAKYERDGVTGVWLFKKLPTRWAAPDRRIPMFGLMADEGSTSFSVEFDGSRTIPLEEFVRLLLSGSIERRRHATTAEEQKVELVYFEHDCWKCEKPSHVYFLREPYQSCCGIAMRAFEGGIWEGGKLEYNSEILAVHDWVTKTLGTQLRVGEIKKRYSDTVRESYVSFGCYWCDAIFGDWYLGTARMEEEMTGDEHHVVSQHTVRVGSPVTVEHSHWCLPVRDGLFCAE